MTLRLSLLLASGAIVIAAAPCRGQRPPSSSEITKLLKAFYVLDHRVAADYTKQQVILAKLDKVPALDVRKERAWRKRLIKAQKRRRRIDKKGRNWFWEKDKRGLYIVGGDARKPKGLFIGMHGGGVGSGDAWSSHGPFNSPAKKAGWLAIFPQVLEKTEHGWTTSGTEEFVLEFAERARRTWKIDPDHVYLGGHSMGGYGTWTLGAHHADRLAGLAASAGAPTPIIDRARAVIDIEPGVVPNLRNVRLVSYQSDDDPQVPPDANRMAAKRMAEAKERWGGFDFEYWEESGRGHGAPPGGMKALIAKVSDSERNARPDEIVWQPTLPWKRQFYWLWWDAPKPEALVEAKLDRTANTVRVTSDAPLTGMYVLLDDELLDLGQEVVVEANGDEVFRGVPEKSLAALVSTGATADLPRTYDVRIPLGR